MTSRTLQTIRFPQGPVNHILSWHGWIPFRKLTYCAYLSHYVFLIADIGTVRTVGDLTPVNVVSTEGRNIQEVGIAEIIASEKKKRIKSVLANIVG